MNKLKIQPHDVVVMSDRANTYTSYNAWVETNAPKYLAEYKMQSYEKYFTDDSDVLSVLCIAPHSKKEPKILCLCRSLLNDKLILVAADDVALESTPFTPCSKIIRRMLNSVQSIRIYDIIVSNLCPDIPGYEQKTKIETAINCMFDEFNITPKEDN